MAPDIIQFEPIRKRTVVGLGSWERRTRSPMAIARACIIVV